MSFAQPIIAGYGVTNGFEVHIYCEISNRYNDKVVLLEKIYYLCAMITKEQVEKFLEDFSLKVKIFGIRFRDDRQKNQNSLIELGITPNQRMEV